MPRKKIYDIKHPKKIEKLEKGIKEFFSPEPAKATRKSSLSRNRTAEGVKKAVASATPKKSAKPTGKKWLFIGAGALVLVLAAFLYVKLPKADIEIWPKVEAMSFGQIVVADRSVQIPDVAKSVIPAQLFEAQVTESEDFPATGNAANEGRATGTITLYNKYDPLSPLTLKAGTRFMSDSGKIFLSLEKVIVPAGKKSGGKVTPGSIAVKVEAAEGGDSYNIKAATFSVPGLKGTAYYFAIYGTSSAAMTGGYAGKVKKVSESDLDTAKDVLSKKAISGAVDEAKKKISDDYVILEAAITSQATPDANQVKVGTVAEQFTYTVTGKASIVAFKKTDAEQFIKSYIISKIPEGQSILEGSLQQEYTVSSLDASLGKVTLNANFSAGVYQSIEKNKVALSVVGQNEEQVKASIENMFGDQVSKVSVNLWPFWVKAVPDSQKAVHISVRFNQ